MQKKFKGEKITKETVVGKEITILDTDFRQSYHIKGMIYILIQAKMDGKLIMFPSGDKAIFRELKMFKEKDYPLVGKIIKKQGSLGEYLMFEYLHPVHSSSNDMESSHEPYGDGGARDVTDQPSFLG